MVTVTYKLKLILLKVNSLKEHSWIILIYIITTTYLFIKDDVSGSIIANRY